MRQAARSVQAVYGWLLLLPAIVLLAAFTHYPALATVWHSFFLHAQGQAPGAVRGPGELCRHAR